MLFLASTISFLVSLSNAHFTLESPPARGFDEDQLGTFPCGGQDEVSTNRTQFPLAGGPIQLNMEHDRSAVQVVLALGNEPGSNFNITIQPILVEQGIGDFCLGNVVLPEGLTDGTNATIQVVTNGDPSGGLYNCADVTLSSSATPGECKNGTGVSTTEYKGTNTNANQTDTEESETSETASIPTSGTSTPTASAAAGGSTSSGAAVAGVVFGDSMLGWGSVVGLWVLVGLLGGGGWLVL